MTITLGWWVIPLLVTIIALVVAYTKAPDSQPTNSYPDLASGLLGLGLMLFAVIVSLVAWLIWAVIK